MSAAPVTGDRRLASLIGGEMSVRFASAAILAVLSLACAWLGGWAAALGVSVVVIVVHVEWMGLTGDGLWPALGFTAALVAGFAILTGGYPVLALGLAVFAVVAAAALAREPWRPAGIAYAAVLGYGILLLRLAPRHGLAAVMLLFSVVWITDTGAFFVGRTLGGARLWPALSPKKTWAGAVGGLVAGPVAGLVVVGIGGLPVTPGLALVAVLLSLASQAGDLFESWVKRRFGVKDSGQIVPGHGGLMDRVDGLTFAAAIATLVGWLHGGPSDLAGGLLIW